MGLNVGSAHLMMWQPKIISRCYNFWGSFDTFLIWYMWWVWSNLYIWCIYLCGFDGVGSPQNSRCSTINGCSMKHLWTALILKWMKPWTECQKLDFRSFFDGVPKIEIYIPSVAFVRRPHVWASKGVNTQMISIDHANFGIEFLDYDIPQWIR